MRNLLAFLGAAVLTFAGIGWYLDWYRIKSTPAPAGHHQLNIDVNRNKIIEDVHKGVQKGEEKLQDFFDNDSETDTAKNAPAAPNNSEKKP